MVTISKARNSVRLQTYHEKDLTNARENYYSGTAQIEGEWRGKLAARWGLTGAVTPEQFTRLAEGQRPDTGEQLVQHRLANQHSAAHRAGWDATFSAPKSVSLTALVGRSHASTPERRALAEQVTQAHREAARIGTDYLERFVDARMGGNKPTQRTGQWVAALFDHDSSRPVNGYAAPQLHTHVVFFNMTETEDGKVRAINEKSLFGAQQIAKAVYQAELRYRLERLGFTIETGKNNAPEIAGYSEDYLRANSTRSEVITERAEQIRREHHVSVAEAKQRAALETREAKLALTSEQVQAMHLACSARHGHQQVPILDAALARQVKLEWSTDPAKVAHEALTYARDHLFESEAVNSESDLVRHALLRAEGRTTLEHIEDALAKRRAQGEFVLVEAGPHRERAYTTAEVLNIERDNIRLMCEGRNQHMPLVTAERIRQKAVARLDHAGPGNQRDAACAILTSNDKVQGLQGAAGTGKTFTLRVIREEVERNGWLVRGFAPTAKATKALADSGMEVSTLQSYLLDVQRHTVAEPARQASRKPTLFVLDEASLADAQQVNRLLRSLHKHDRLLLVGDVRQHESVGAGRVFSQLQEHGMSTAHLTKIIRQKDAPDLKHVVELFYQGRVREGVQVLKDLGCIKEVKNERDRCDAIARTYLQDRAHTLVVSPDNRSRGNINSAIHQHLQDAKHISAEDHTLRVLMNRQDISGAQRTWARNYEAGNVLLYGTTSRRYGIKANEYVTVTGVDAVKNTITVQRKNGTHVTYNPARFKGIVGAYRPAERTFSAGDVIQFTAKSKPLGVANRDRAIITGFTDRGKMRVQLYRGADEPPGHTLTIDPAKFPHIDYAYAVTSYTSQGLTEVNSILNVDIGSMNPKLINDRLAYVAGSRMKMSLTIYCDDADGLAAALSRDVSKTAAIQPPERGLSVGKKLSNSAEIQHDQGGLSI